MTTLGALLVALATLHAAYTFAGYPLALWLLARIRPRPPAPPAARTAPTARRTPAPDAAAGARPASEPASDGALPHVSLTVPVYNEAAQIDELLENLLALDYPRDRLQILVISDASDDGTDEIVRSYAPRGVELLRVPVRRGKTAAENAARSHVRGDIVVNTDASIRLHPRAIRALVAAFADPTVGVASGRDVSTARDAGTSNEGEARYVGYEMWVRELETRVHGIVGASGCLFAMRRELHAHPTPEALSRDFDSALIARAHGMRAVTVPDAICYVPRTGSLRREYRRKTRTVTRGLATLLSRRHLLNPARHGVFAWMLFSHKLCRWLVPWAALAGIAGVAILAARATSPGIVAAAAVALATGGRAMWLRVDAGWIPRPVALALYVAAANVATLHAWARVALGRAEPVWEPTRREPARRAAPSAGR